MKLFIASTLVLAFLGTVLGEGIGQTNKRHEFMCGEIPINFKSLYDSREDPVMNFAVDGVLHRRCPTFFIIDFHKHQQNLTAYYHSVNFTKDHPDQQFFSKPDFGERFLFQQTFPPSDTGVEITLVPEIVNLSREDIEKYQMISVTITRREEFDTVDNQTFVDADLHVEKVAKEKVKLSPGWLNEDLRSATDMLTQTLIPGEHSPASLKRQQVTVMRGWLTPRANSIRYVHAEARFKDGIHQFITIFLEKPSIDDLMPESIDITLDRRDDNGEPKHEPAKLVPGWIGELEEPTLQKLVYHKAGHDYPISFNVTVWPGAHYKVNPSKGIQAHLSLGYQVSFITIYYHPEAGKPEDDFENRSGMFEIVDIVKLVNQTFANEQAALQPGWFGVLKGETQQLAIPYQNGQTAPVGVNATVSPGWRVFPNGTSGFNAHYRRHNILYPISVVFKQNFK